MKRRRCLVEQTVAASVQRLFERTSFLGNKISVKRGKSTARIRGSIWGLTVVIQAVRQL